jgi:hypothetical protein
MDAKEYQIHDCQCGGPECGMDKYIVVMQTYLDGHVQYDDVSDPCLSLDEAESIVNIFIHAKGFLAGESDRFEFEIEPNWESIYGFKNADGKYVIYQKRHGGDDKHLYTYDDRTIAYLAARKLAQIERTAVRSTWFSHEFLTKWSDGDPDPANEMELYLFHAGKQDHAGRDILAYRFYDGPYTIFEGMDFSNSPLNALDSPETISAMLSFLSLEEGDTDAEYFEDYSSDQLEWRDARAEDLKNSMYDFQSTFDLEEYDMEEDEGEDEEKDSPEDYRIGKLSGGLGFEEQEEEENNNEEDNLKNDMIQYLRDSFPGEDPSYFDAQAAIYWFAHDYHGGQASELYSILSTSRYSPGPMMSNASDEGDIVEMMYDALVEWGEPRGLAGTNRPADFEQNFPAMIIPVLRSHEGLNLHKSYERGIIASNLARVLGVNRDALLHFLTRNHADISLSEENMKKLAVSISAWMRSGRVKMASPAGSFQGFDSPSPDEFARMFNLPSIENVEEGSFEYISEAGQYGWKEWMEEHSPFPELDRDKFEGWADEARYAAEGRAQDEIHMKWRDAIHSVVSHFLDKIGLVTYEIGDKIIPLEEWDIAAEKIRQVIDGVGYVHVGNDLKEFLDLGPWTPRQAVEGHWKTAMLSYHDVYGGTSPEQMYNRSWS